MKRLAAFLLSALITGVLIAETITITLPDGSEWAIEATQVNGGGAGESPPDEAPPDVTPEQPAPPPPVPEPDPVPVPVPVPDPTPEPPSFTSLGPVRHTVPAGLWKPVYRSKTDIDAMYARECPNWKVYEVQVGATWSPTFNAKTFTGCVHIKGVTGADGTKPFVSVGSLVKSYRGDIRRGGVWLENVRTGAIGVPNDMLFLRMTDMDASGWGSHGLITGSNAHHLVVHFEGNTTFKDGNGSHAIYIDQVAAVRVDGKLTVCNPGTGHALRSIAAVNLIDEIEVSNVDCDGTLTAKRGMPPLDLYAISSGSVQKAKVTYYRSPTVVTQAVEYRNRPDSKGLWRYALEGDVEYREHRWGTPEYADPAIWQQIPRNKLSIGQLDVVCPAEPCVPIQASSDYPMFTIGQGRQLMEHWQQFPGTPEGWDLFKQHTDQTWIDSLNLLLPARLDQYISERGRGIPQTARPLAVPDAWESRAYLDVGSVTLNGQPVAPQDAIKKRGAGNWCFGARDADGCVDAGRYLSGVTVGGTVLHDPNGPIVLQPSPTPTPAPAPAPVPVPPAAEVYRMVADIASGMQVNEVKVIPGAEATGVLLPKGCTPDYPPGSDRYLKCYASHNDWLTWTGMAHDLELGKSWLIAGGGHSDNGTNAVYEFDWATMTWARSYDGSPPNGSPIVGNMPIPEGATKPTCPELINGPMGHHSYAGHIWLPTQRKVYMARTTGYQPGGCTRRDIQRVAWLFDPETNDYTPTGITEMHYPRGVYDAARDRVYLIGYRFEGIQNRGYEYDPATGQIVKQFGTGWAGQGGSAAWDEQAREMWWYGRGKGLYRRRIALDGSASQTVVKGLPSTYASNQGIGLTPTYALLWGGRNTVDRYHRKTGAWDTVTLTGDTVPYDSRGSGRVYTKFICPPQVPGVCVGWPHSGATVIIKVE